MQLNHQVSTKNSNVEGNLYILGTIFKPKIKSPQIPMVTFLSVTYDTEIGGKDKHENCKSSTTLHWSMFIFLNFCSSSKYILYCMYNVMTTMCQEN